jgi:hypothetical protein
MDVLIVFDVLKWTICVYITAKNQVQKPSTITSKHFYVLIVRFSDNSKRKGRLSTERQKILIYLILPAFVFSQ